LPRRTFVWTVQDGSHVRRRVRQLRR
jgi:hypothetical protein